MTLEQRMSNEQKAKARSTSLIESTSYRPRRLNGTFRSSHGQNLTITDTPATVLEAFTYASATIPQKLLILLKRRGPWTAVALHKEIVKAHSVKVSTVRAYLYELSKLGLAVRANGGWCCMNWKELS